LVIHFNRLAYNNYGEMFVNRNFVEFPEHLNIDPSKYLPFEIDMNYKLVSVIEHRGTP